METREESVEEAIISLKFVCNMKEGKGESLFIVQLTLEIDSVNAIQSNVPSKIMAAIKLKGGAEVNFQVDTGETCDVLKLSATKGAKYTNRITPTNQVIKMYNVSTLRPPKILKKALKRFHFPMPVIEDILPGWTRSKFLLKSIARMAIGG